MIEPGTYARGWYRWPRCQSWLGWRTPMFIKSGPVRMLPSRWGVSYT